MNFINILAILFYGLAFFFVIYILFGMFYKSQKNTTIIYETPVYEETPVVTEVVYPWYSGYNWWPYWGYGGYGPWGYRTRPYPGPRHYGPRGGIRTGVRGGGGRGRGGRGGGRR